MPMDVDEEELVGEPADEVPKQESTDEDCRGKRVDDGAFVGYCQAWPGQGTDHVGEGRCKFHGGLNSGENGQGARADNENAVTHGAFREHFTSGLTEGERMAFDDAYDQLGEPESAQDVGRAAASICLLQFRRSGDERFLRRFEGLCDKFGIAPEDVERHEHTGEDGGPIEVNITRERYDGD